jgi:hypothetical protein
MLRQVELRPRIDGTMRRFAEQGGPTRAYVGNVRRSRTLQA